MTGVAKATAMELLEQAGHRPRPCSTCKGSLRLIYFATPSFVSGLASVIELGGTLAEFNYSDTGDQADAMALRADWEAISEDFREAVGAFERDVEAATATW